MPFLPQWALKSNQHDAIIRQLADKHGVGQAMTSAIFYELHETIATGEPLSMLRLAAKYEHLIQPSKVVEIGDEIILLIS
jgi:hypothetical protein